MESRCATWEVLPTDYLYSFMWITWDCYASCINNWFSFALKKICILNKECFKLPYSCQKFLFPETKCTGFAVVIHLFSHVQLFVTPWTAAQQASMSFSISQSLLKLMSTESMMPSNHSILCCPLLLLPSIFPSMSIFSNELALHIRWPKYWSFSFSISPSNEYSGLMSFRIDWFDLLAVWGTLKSLLQHHSLKESVLWCSAFFKV